ncbi:MAG: hypothetical protein XD50_0555 [Clostridia bacterium 41_269]|nr:MAG: hypothetical protein XD50_0555 [Clostridia bacterium 41_269]
MGLVDDLQRVFPRLDLKPTLEGTMIKIAEEVGEMSEIVGKIRGLSGEDKKTALLKLLSRDMGREISDALGAEASIDIRAIEQIAEKYAKMREKIIKDEISEREIEVFIARELLDVMQTCATFAYQLDVDMEALLKEHRQKLIRRGYLKE